MIELIDTHAHLDEEAFDVDQAEVIDRAEQSGVQAIITIGTTLASSRRAISIAEGHDIVFAAVGIQPNYVAEAQPDDWNAIVDLADHPKVVAIGETGLDRYWDYAPIELQQNYFDRHIELSARVNKPFVVHCRESETDIVAQLQSHTRNGQPLRGVMHSFCGDTTTAEACLDLGLYISFAGMLTFKKNEDLRATACQIPLDRLLVETDAPYLSPVPKRGKRNEPAHVLHTAKCLAGLQASSLEEFAQQTTANARSLFGL